MTGPPAGRPDVALDPVRLAARLAAWRTGLGKGEIHHLAAGANWVRLHLADADHTALVLVAMPDMHFTFAHQGPLPAPLRQALAPNRDHPLPRLLAAARLVGLGALPGDRVACFHFRRDDGRTFYLLQQLFGSPGNLVLLDDAAVLHWALRRPPHRLLTAVPPTDTWHHGDPTAVDRDESLRHLATGLARRQAAEAATELGRRGAATQRLRENLAADFAVADQGERYRRQAEALAAHLHLVTPGTDELEIADPRDGTPLRIALDPALAPAANLAAWFRRARKAERGHDVIAERLAAAEEQARILARQTAQLETWLTVTTRDQEQALHLLTEVQAWRERHPEFGPSDPAGRRAPSPEEPARPFRRYLIDDRWEVWIGRNNRENDDLTYRAAHGRDIWLHAQGIAGSHVILRTGGHPERVPGSVLERAAALAALNSKARHSGLVPVIHTERRYVRKPRKSPPGTAVTLRDKSLFVVPGLSSGVQAI